MTTSAKKAEPRSIVGSWRVERITDKAVNPDMVPTVEFMADGKVSGSASCNRFSGSYEVKGEALSIGETATTRMMCPPPVMDQEDRMLGALGSAERYEFDGDVLLIYSKYATLPSRLISQ